MPSPISGRVAAVLVCRDGARWLPTVVDGLRSQTVAPDVLVVVDTGSKDDSVALLADLADEVLTPGSRTSYPEAVDLALAALPEDVDWVWLLHDDSTPAPDALDTLLTATREYPDSDILGPKLREWPSLKRLLEVGVTISGTGRRETGLERGEYDQGQHDEVRRVLAVNSAGMLAKRRVLERLGGFDIALPIFGNDLDLGWRAANAGYRTVVVPHTTVFHAEAAHRGLRQTPLTGRHTHYAERRAALYTLLANTESGRLPWLVVRLFLGTLVRMVGFLLLRSVGQALDDLAAVVNLYTHPGEIRAARRARAGQQTADPAEVRALLSPWWLPYRHGLDFVGDIVSAAFNQAQDVAERRRLAAEAAAPAPIRRPAVADEDAPAEDTGWVVRFLTNPLAVGVTLYLVLALVGARAAIGHVSGGALSPAPESAQALMHLHTEAWHALLQGTAVPAPPYVFPLALLSAVLGGSVAFTVSALLLLAVPLALWGAWRFLRVAGRLVDPAGSPTWLVALAAATYALVPVTSGAWEEGRLSTVVVTVLLPWLAHAALGFADPETDRRWRAAWRTSVLLALVTAFTPAAWVFAVLVIGALLGAGRRLAPDLVRDRSVWLPPLVPLASVPVLLSPWWLPALLHGAGSMLLVDGGRAPYPSFGFVDLVAGRFAGHPGSPWWLGVVVVVLAAAALVPRATRIPVVVVWIVALLGALTAAVLGAVTLHLPTGDTEPGLSFFLVLLRGAFVTAGLLGIQGLVTLLRRNHTGTGRALLAGLALLAAVVPAVGLAWFVGSGPGELADDTDDGIPAYMEQAAEQRAANGILVIRGDVAGGLTFTVLRGNGVTLGQDEILAATEPDAAFSDDVRALVSRPTPAVVDDLAAAGIEYVVLPAPADGDVAAGLDGTGGLVQASAEDRSTRAWQVGPAVDPHAVDGPSSPLRTVLLVLQGLAVVVVLVLCLPTWRRER